MSQKLESITLHGINDGDGLTPVAPRASYVTPSPAELKGDFQV